MELLMNSDFYVLVNDKYSLWCSRSDGSLIPKNASDVEKLSDFVCLGIVFGVIGKFTIQHDIDKRLILVRDRSIVGCLPNGHDVYKIKRIALLPLNQQHLPDVEFEVCKKHRFNPKKLDKPSNIPDVQHKAFQKTWNTLKAATSQVKTRKVWRSIFSTASFLTSNVILPVLFNEVDLGPWSVYYQILAMQQPKEQRDREKLEKKLIEEFTKMFTETDSFYYSMTGDLTNSIQRQYTQSKDPLCEALPLWKKIDDRFFWNKHMLSELINLECDLADPWIIPVIQGFVQIEQCWIDTIDDADTLSAEGVRFFSPPINSQESLGKNYTMVLISRRSRHRAGTRYKRRGVDESGKCANYVETEQIFEYSSHIVSFVQVRGSVPVFWSQPGYKYRPPPQLDKGEEETQIAFEKHFEDELKIYNSQVIINLMEQCGKEKVINDAYLNHILDFSCPDLVYVSFDFHEYCRGMKFENVSVLIESIQDIIRDMRYCWIDSEGMICEQRGVFRVNCVDCLDRTNIVQTALAKTVMDIQFNKLGLLPPEGVLPAGCRRIFQMLWANNGDIISRQYAGTVALKGDYTRTGERRIAGMMKDGYHSANRYYVNRFKDAFRQATIDLMMGNPVTEDITAVTPEREEADTEIEINEQEHHERVKQLIEDCKKILIPETEVVLGGWALIDADPVTGDPDKQDMDAILILTKDSYFVAEYDDQTDRIIKYQHVLLEDLERIELGPEPGVFKSKHHCLRLHYSVYGQSGYFHMFRSTNTRFFNNMAVPICSEEEAAESLKAICETFKVALCVKELNVPIFEGKLERRKSKMPLSQAGVRAGVFRSNRNHHHSHNPNHGFHLELPSFSSMPRNISEGQLNSLKTVGSRALSNMTSHFAKLNPITTVKALRKKAGNGSTASAPTILASVDETSATMSPRFNIDSSSDSDEDSVLHHKAYTMPGFHGHISDRTLSSDYSEFSDVDEQELMLSTECLNMNHINGANLNSKHDTVLESCGILATYNSKSNEGIVDNYVFMDNHSNYIQRRYNTEVDDFVLDAMKKATLRQISRKTSKETKEAKSKQHLPLTSMPQIHISTESNLAAYTKPDDAAICSGKIGVSRKLSKSSEDLDFRPCMMATSNEVSHLLVQEEVMLDTDGMNAKMKTSHSESAIQDFSLSSLNLSNTLSPIAIKKDLVLSPLSRIAKGVQNFGMNLRPGHRHISPLSPDTEDYEKVKLRRKNCATRIIEL